MSVSIDQVMIYHCTCAQTASDSTDGVGDLMSEVSAITSKDSPQIRNSKTWYVMMYPHCNSILSIQLTLRLLCIECMWRVMCLECEISDDHFQFIIVYKHPQMFPNK